MMNLGDRKMRSWVGLYQFPGKKPFRAWTNLLPMELTDTELRAALDEAFRKSWDEHFPDGFEMPPLINYVPGAIFFVPEKDL